MDNRAGDLKICNKEVKVPQAIESAYASEEFKRSQ